MFGSMGSMILSDGREAIQKHFRRGLGLEALYRIARHKIRRLAGLWVSGVFPQSFFVSSCLRLGIGCCTQRFSVAGLVFGGHFESISVSMPSPIAVQNDSSSKA